MKRITELSKFGEITELQKLPDYRNFMKLQKVPKFGKIMGNFIKIPYNKKSDKITELPKFIELSKFS